MDLSSMGRPGDPLASLLNPLFGVEYLCPECGGDTAPSGLVLLCWACHGRGKLTSDELSTYMRRVGDGT